MAGSSYHIGAVASGPSWFNIAYIIFTGTLSLLYNLHALTICHGSEIYMHSHSPVRHCHHLRWQTVRQIEIAEIRVEVVLIGRDSSRCSSVDVDGLVGLMGAPGIWSLPSKQGSLFNSTARSHDSWDCRCHRTLDHTNTVQIETRMDWNSKGLEAFQQAYFFSLRLLRNLINRLQDLEKLLKLRHFYLGQTQVPLTSLLQSWSESVLL